jgi:hypothetical protein
MLLFSATSLSSNNDQWIIVTTINYPTDAIRKLVSQTDWRVVAVADKKTPRDWQYDGCELLTVERQLQLKYEIIKHIPWNHYSRKNIGYLYAIEHGAKVIYETDDDNLLKSDINYLTHPNEIKSFDTQWSIINPYNYFGRSDVWPRGYPLDHILHKKSYEPISSVILRPLIQQGLVDNDPDVDAIFRLTRGELITFNENPPIAVPRDMMAPFNTQNTLFHYEAFWGLLIPITTTFRVCDIWRGYVTQRLLWDIGGNLCFTKATATQERNKHDLLKDFIDEQDLYHKTGPLIRYLLQWESKKQTLFERIIELHEELIKAEFYKPKELALVKAWIHDLQMLGYRPPTIIA